jgi:hypothetical protein
MKVTFVQIAVSGDSVLALDESGCVWVGNLPAEESDNLHRLGYWSLVKSPTEEFREWLISGADGSAFEGKGEE